MTKPCVNWSNYAITYDFPSSELLYNAAGFEFAGL